MRRRRAQTNQETEQFMLSFSDLFAGMIGVTMLFVVYFFTFMPLEQFKIGSKPIPFSEKLSKEVKKVTTFGGGFAETVYCNPDHVVVSGLNDKEIKIKDIMSDEELKAYLKRLYLEQGGEVLFMTGSASYASEDKFQDLLYELGRENEKFLNHQKLFIHDNLDFIFNEDLKKEYRKKWGLESKSGDMP